MSFLILLSQYFYNLAITIVLLFVVIYVYFRYSYTYWKRKGVPYIEPKFPLGNNECVGLEAFSYGVETVEWYKELKRRGLKYGGAWSFANPVLLITDTEYIKDILLKDFSYFCDRDFYHNPKYDPKNESVFVAEKEEWKVLRQKLTPTFTSAKMKMMFFSVVQCSEPMMTFLEKAALSGDDVDSKEILASFTTDVIGCVAFGLDFRSFSSQDAKFRQIGKEIFRSTIKSNLLLVMSRLCPKLSQHLGIYNIPANVTNFFTEIITETLRFRKENNIKKPDFLQLVSEIYEESKSGKGGDFSFDDVIGNVIVFFVAGFDTSSTTMHFALYELAQDIEKQETVRNEINAVLEKHNGEFSYEAMNEMTYLRQVVDETLRKYPPVQNLARFCVKPYKFRDTDFTLEKGVSVIIPALALGRDPEHFPEPEKFDPERFSPENKGNINPFAYLPFGEGPRNCIGKRFGLMQSLIGLKKILKDFKVSISPSTKMPLSLKHGIFLMLSNETLYLKFEKC